jgi:hypothetical protein
MSDKYTPTTTVGGMYIDGIFRPTAVTAILSFDPDKGRKFDSGKPMMSLLPPHAMLAVGRVLTFGAQKYSKDNWKRVPSAKQRYMDAMMRHAFHFMSGEERDSETGENHLAHLICCASFILDAAESGNDLPE